MLFLFVELTFFYKVKSSLGNFTVNAKNGTVVKSKVEEESKAISIGIGAAMV